MLRKSVSTVLVHSSKRLSTSVERLCGLGLRIRYSARYNTGTFPVSETDATSGTAVSVGQEQGLVKPDAVRGRHSSAGEVQNCNLC